MSHPLSPDDAIRADVMAEVTKTMGAAYARKWRHAHVIRGEEDVANADFWDTYGGKGKIYDRNEPRIIVRQHEKEFVPPDEYRWRVRATVFPSILPRTRRWDPEDPEPRWELEYLLPCEMCGRIHTYIAFGDLPEPGKSLGLFRRKCIPGNGHRPFRNDCVFYRGRGEDSLCHMDHGSGVMYEGYVELFMPERFTDEERAAQERFTEALNVSDEQLEGLLTKLLAPEADTPVTFTEVPATDRDNLIHEPSAAARAAAERASKHDVFEAEFQQTAAALSVALNRPATFIEVHESMIRAHNARKADEAASNAEAV